MNILRDILHPYKINDKLIHLGSKADGGYVLNELTIKSLKHCFTYGVGSEIEFENQLLDINPYIRVNLHDHTIHHHPPLKTNISFFSKGLGGHEEGNLNTCFQHLKDNKVLDSDKVLLKIDAEGAEYPLFDENSIDLFQNFDAMIIEFHYINNQLDNFIKIVNDINKYFYIIHIHGNNCGGQFNYGDFICPTVPEITFVNKKLFNLTEKVSHNYPIQGLDYPNDINLKDLEIFFN